MAPFIFRLAVAAFVAALATTDAQPAPPAASKTPVFKLIITGQTGTGKSTIAEAFARHLGYDKATPAFTASSQIHAHTQAPTTVEVASIKITDTPGLMDTAGREKDVRNMEMIVNAVRCGVGERSAGLGLELTQHPATGAVQAKIDGELHAVLLTLNENNPRFDSPLQNSMKLLADSFGPAVLKHTALLFSHSDGRVSPAQAQERAAAIAEVMRGLTGVDIAKFEVFQVDALIESRPGSTTEYIRERKAENARNFDALAAWVRAQAPLPTVDFKAGEYAEMKRLREEREAREAAEAARKAAEEALAAAERARVAYAAQVVVEAAAKAEAAEAAHKQQMFLLGVGIVASVVGVVFFRGWQQQRRVRHQGKPGEDAETV